MAAALLRKGSNILLGWEARLLEIIIFKIAFNFFLCVRMRVCVCKCATARVWRSEGSLERLVLSFHHVDLSDQ